MSAPQCALVIVSATKAGIITFERPAKDGIRKSVFGSNSERKHYKHLARNWGDRYRIYHNLPFLNVFDVSNLIDWSNLEELKGITIGDVDLSRLKKTSIDFTLCHP